MQETHTLIVGASVSGLASAASLQQYGIEHILIEKEPQVAMPWRNHYQRLHLHTSKGLSHLPYKKFNSHIPRYPSRQQVVDYLEEYQHFFNIQPLFNTEATAIKKNDSWITETNKGTFHSKYIIMATGVYSQPRKICFKGMDTFSGTMMHSSEYKTGSQFKGEKVLVVGFGNSACEIALDLYEQGAKPAMAVRSPVNVIPREVFGIPILRISLLMSKLPPRIADALSAPLMRLLLGDITKLGLQKMQYGTFEQIRKDRTIPLIDIGTLQHIRQGHIQVYKGIQYIDGNTICFTDGKQSGFDAIIAAIGYEQNIAGLLNVDNSRFGDLKVCTNQQQYFGKDGLYFCGFWVGPTGLIREIALDAQKIARDIAAKKSKYYKK